MSLGYAIAEHAVGSTAGAGTFTLVVSGDPTVGGGALSEPPKYLFDPSEIQWRSQWEIIHDCGDMLDIPLHNPAVDCSGTVALADRQLPANFADVPVNAGTYQFTLDGITYTVTIWRIYWYAMDAPYEDLYDWSECPPCIERSYNAQKYWTGNNGNATCGTCFAGQLDGTNPDAPAPGDPVPTNAVTLHFTSRTWDTSFARYRWNTVRRFQRDAPGGTAAPEEKQNHRIQQVWELKASTKPTEFPRHIKPQGGS